VKDSPAGYSGVGRIVAGAEGTGFAQGDLVFTRGHHAGVVDLPKEKARRVFIRIGEKWAKEATFLELGKVAMHGLHRVQIEVGDWVVVYGLGVVGNLTAQLARLAAAGRAIAVEPLAARREIAEKIGIRTFAPDREGLVEEILGLTRGGASAVIETSGHPAALAQAMKIAAVRGRISVVAGHYGSRELDLKTDFQNKELSLIGARRIDEVERTTADRWPVGECRQAVYEMIERGDLAIGPLITHCLPPEEAPAVFDRLMQRDQSMLGVLFDWREAGGA